MKSGKVEKGLKVMDGSWGMDGDHMGEHGRWVDGANCKNYIPVYYNI
jgi:hypothetical protein